ncbi:MAG: SDR family oxidoreductase [Methylophilaceae bacterium]
MSASVLIVGCGDLGLEVARRLRHSDFDVTGVRRSNQALPEGARLIQADVTKPQTLVTLAETRPDILIYCVAANAHTDESYREQYVDGLRNTLAALNELKSLRHIFFVSSTGVYGQQTDAFLDETSPAMAADFTGERMLEAEALLQGYPATILRFSGIYGPGRTRMIQLAKTPAQWPTRNGWTNRIHRDDGAAFIVYLIQRLGEGKAPEKLYLVTDTQPITQYALLNWLAKQQGVDASEVIVPPIQGNKRLDNSLMLSTGFKFTYPDYQAGYAQLLSLT